MTKVNKTNRANEEISENLKQTMKKIHDLDTENDQLNESEENNYNNNQNNKASSRTFKTSKDEDKLKLSSSNQGFSSGFPQSNNQSFHNNYSNQNYFPQNGTQGGFLQSQQQFTQSQQGFNQSQQGFNQSQQGFNQSQQGFNQSQNIFNQSQLGNYNPPQEQYPNNTNNSPNFGQLYLNKSKYGFQSQTNFKTYTDSIIKKLDDLSAEMEKEFNEIERYIESNIQTNL